MLPNMKTAQHYTSRTADKFVVRLPDGMREHIAEVARQHHRSMNSEIINDQQMDSLSHPERELLLRFREMTRRQQNALLALLPGEENVS